MVDATDGDDVFDVFGHTTQRHVRIKATVASQIAREEVASDQTIGSGDHLQLFVVEVAGTLAKGMASAVRGDKWFGADVGNIHEARAVQVGKVDHDAELVARNDEILAGRGESRTNIIAAWPPEPNTGSEYVGP